mmetsp:Transcript_31267/g.72920  ORF Transcript_31267/g.72920 Transcript_31267/m.72920 type:complete len:258 (+) Transcript_31267:109-882(+)
MPEDVKSELSAFQPTAANDSIKLDLKVVLPDGALVSLEVHRWSTGAMLRQLLETVCQVRAGDVKVILDSGGESPAKSLDDGATLEAQGMSHGSQLRVQRLAGLPPSSEAGKAALHESLSRHGKLSYYQAERTSHSSGAARVELDKTVKPSFTWADDGASVKVFIDAAEERRMVQTVSRLKAAGMVDAVSARFEKDSLDFTVQDCEADGALRFQLAIHNLSDPIVPDRCKWRMSSDEQRITISLRKADPAKRWFSLHR